LYCYDGQIGCSAGSSAGLDLGIEVIRNDYGHDIANSVARRLVVSAHRKGSQSQFSEAPVQRENSQFSAALDWALRNLNTDFDINVFAEKAFMSRRSFDRKFKANFNLSPKEWLTHQRLNYAKSMLETKEFSIEKIAELTGFNNSITMRHHFRKELGISPTFYRDQFKSNSANS
jgi:AraC family transcriptional activator FtrA